MVMEARGRVHFTDDPPRIPERSIEIRNQDIEPEQLDGERCGNGSAKFTVERFADLAEKAGWTLEASWCSEEPAFAVVSLLA